MNSCQHERILVEPALGYDVIKDIDIEGTNYICADCGECLNAEVALGEL